MRIWFPTPLTFLHEELSIDVKLALIWRNSKFHMYEQFS